MRKLEEVINVGDMVRRESMFRYSGFDYGVCVRVQQKEYASRTGWIANIMWYNGCTSEYEVPAGSRFDDHFKVVKRDKFPEISLILNQLRK